MLSGDGDAPARRRRLRQRRPPARHRVGLDPGRAGSLRAAAGSSSRRQHKRELVGTSAEIAGGILERRLGEPGRAAELIEELNELVVAELEHGVEAMVGASELLHRLKRRGTPIGLVSNSPLIFVRRSLEIVGFVDHFDVVLSAHEVAAPKPAPDPYLEACRRLGVEAGPAVVALEDSPTGVAAARAAGLTVIGVPSLEGIELAEAHEIAESLLDEVVTHHLAL